MMVCGSSRWIFGVALAVLGALVLGSPIACGDAELVRVQPPFQVVDGTPGVDDGRPGADWRVPEVNPDDFMNNAPLQVDMFLQETVRKVDILWLVDNSPKMKDAQESLADNFEMFINDLVGADPPINYHLAVVTTDAATERGLLRQLIDSNEQEIMGADGRPLRFIACNDPDLDEECNVGSEADAEEIFKQTVQVGVEGTPIERGLLAVQLALSEPLHSGDNAGFLRDDAALYMIAISEEDDSSCRPFFNDPATSETLPNDALNYEGCNFYPGCRCADDDELFYGSVEYFVRFFEGLKGFGNEHLVTLATIVADDEHAIVLCLDDEECLQHGQFRGCRNDELDIMPMYAPRYIEVAARTGGSHISLCEDDYGEVLADLGFAASGQRRSFELSRQPASPDRTPIDVVMERPDDDGGTITEEVPHISEGNGGWEYVRCESGEFVNVIRFHGDWIPPAGAWVRVTYLVSVGGTTAC